MIALPVLAVSAAEVVYQTSDVAGAESLDRRLGSADARVVVSPGSGRVIQGFDPDRDPSGSLEEERPAAHAREGRGPRSDATSPPPSGATAGSVSTRRAGSSTWRPPSSTWPRRSSRGCSGSPTAAGRRRPPRSPSTTRSPRRASPPGPSSPSTTARTLTVVGTAESTTTRGYPLAVGTLGALGIPTTEGQATWLVGGGPVSWDEVARTEPGRRDRAVARGRGGPAAGLRAARPSSRSGRPRPTTRSSRSSC